tara:strand:+ start:1111 stop:1437 length:327 start_codon:yes stop_codon:yes gene_type:complete
MDDDEEGWEGDVIAVIIPKKKEELKEPRRFKVIIINDDYTPMDFVVSILTMFFNKTIDEADALTAEIHKNGKGIAGVYPLEIAEMKLRQAMKLSRKEEHPLSIKLESE